MIDEKKLLCAFIYSAYASGYCGLKLDRPVREEHMQMYRDYIKNGGYFPEKEIAETQKHMMDSVSVTGIRDYLYRGHFDVVRKRIEQDTGKDFEEALRSEILLLPALQCPVNLYTVLEVKDSALVCRHLFLPKLQKDIVVLEGLEKPSVGDVVSSHWGYFLEVLHGEAKAIYQKHSRDYIDTILRSIK
jgi:hypothetical protein